MSVQFRSFTPQYNSPVKSPQIQRNGNGMSEAEQRLSQLLKQALTDFPDLERRKNIYLGYCQELFRTYKIVKEEHGGTETFSTEMKRDLFNLGNMHAEFLGEKGMRFYLQEIN
jgi:hypothetical protein